jgi:hypothetical protein
VLFKGRLVAIADAADHDRAAIGRLMTAGTDAA